MQIATQTCITLLMLLSAYVFQGINRGQNMWLFISLYWLVLTIKNVLDFWKERRKP